LEKYYLAFPDTGYGLLTARIQQSVSQKNVILSGKKGINITLFLSGIEL